jgi:hypothetical protein
MGGSYLSQPRDCYPSFRKEFNDNSYSVPSYVGFRVAATQHGAGWVGAKAGDSKVVRAKDHEIAFRWCPPGHISHQVLRHPGDGVEGVTTPLTGYWIQETVVTQGLWADVMGTEDPQWKRARDSVAEQPEFDVPAGSSELLFYSPSDRVFWLGQFKDGALAWSKVGNASNFGSFDGVPFWVGRFTGDALHGCSELLFYSPADKNWWLADYRDGSLVWSAVANTPAIEYRDGVQSWTGSFTGGAATELLLYSPGDRDFWLGRFQDGTLAWSKVGSASRFGSFDGVPFWAGSFTGGTSTELMFYSPGDRNFRLGQLGDGTLAWKMVGNASHFGSFDGVPFWAGNFNGGTSTELLFYSPGDRNWWLGDVVSSSLAWTMVGNTPKMDYYDGVKFWTGDFTGRRSTELLCYSPDDENWWLGQIRHSALEWKLASQFPVFS